MERRKIITGLVALIAAPTVVRADNLMKISGDRYFAWDYSCPIFPDIGWAWEAAYKKGISFSEYAKPWIGPNGGFYEGTWTFLCKHGEKRSIYTNEQIAFNKHEVYAR